MLSKNPEHSSGNKWACRAAYCMQPLLVLRRTDIIVLKSRDICAFKVTDQKQVSLERSISNFIDSSVQCCAGLHNRIWEMHTQASYARIR
jgi:hypothetical protein